MLHVKSPVPPSVAEQTSNPLDCKTEGGFRPEPTLSSYTVVEKSAVQCGKVAEDQKAICQHYESWGESKGLF